MLPSKNVQVPYVKFMLSSKMFYFGICNAYLRYIVVDVNECSSSMANECVHGSCHNIEGFYSLCDKGGGSSGQSAN